MKLTIKRSRWFRGRGSLSSKLVRKNDGKLCCLGFYGIELGIPKKEMENIESPENCNRWDEANLPLINKKYKNNTLLCQKLMTTNDESGIPEHQREKDIKKLFKRIGVSVTFVD